MKVLTLLSLLVCSATLLCQKAKYDEDLNKTRILYTDSIERVVLIPSDTNNKLDTDANVVAYTSEADVTDKIDSIINKISAYNKNHPPKVKGFRVQIYNGRSESAANKALSEAKSVVGEEIFSETVWKAPVFRTRIGCFSTRLEAFQVALQLEKYFPNALIVPDYSLTADCIK